MIHVKFHEMTDLDELGDEPQVSLWYILNNIVHFRKRFVTKFFGARHQRMLGQNLLDLGERYKVRKAGVLQRNAAFALVVCLVRLEQSVELYDVDLGFPKIAVTLSKPRGGRHGCAYVTIG